MRRTGIATLALLLSIMALIVALWGGQDGPPGLTGLTGPAGQGIQGQPGPAGKGGASTTVIVYRDRQCPKYELPAVPKEGADYALRLVTDGSCPVYRFVLIFGKDGP
jgi:hypothetical protein